MGVALRFFHGLGFSGQCCHLHPDTDDYTRHSAGTMFPLDQNVVAAHGSRRYLLKLYRRFDSNLRRSKPAECCQSLFGSVFLADPRDRSGPRSPNRDGLNVVPKRAEATGVDNDDV